jgi:hypothetical protein
MRFVIFEYLNLYSNDAKQKQKPTLFDKLTTADSNLKTSCDRSKQKKNSVTFKNGTLISTISAAPTKTKKLIHLITKQIMESSQLFPMKRWKFLLIKLKISFIKPKKKKNCKS